MCRPLRCLLVCLALNGGASWGGTAPAGAQPALRLSLVPTFASIGVYADVDAPLDGLSAALRYRRTGDTDWHEALAPVADPDRHQFRGSVLLLAAGNDYEVDLRLQRGSTVVAGVIASARTWSESVPVAREITLPAGRRDKPFVIDARGTPDGWIRYRAAPGAPPLDAGTTAPHAIILDHAACVIVEGAVVRGGARDAVLVLDSHDVRIQNCDIAGWGDPGRWGFYADQKRRQWAFLDASGKIIDRQAGIRVQGAGSARVVLQGNLIHHPRGTTATCWAFQHPHGPSGIVLSETGGHNVVRDNDLIPGDGHRWNDAIESEYNGEVNGGPYRDTDLYGNLLVDPNDDGTELDGGQINVRHRHNRIEGGLCGVSCAPDLRGPSYIFRNVIVSGDERGACGRAFKMGGDPGVAFLFNNTTYVGNYGLSSGHYGANPSFIVSRNNLFAGPAPGLGRVRFDRSVIGDLDHDVIPPGGLLGIAEPHPGREGGAVFALPKFIDPAARDFRLAPDSAARGAGVAVPGIAATQSEPGAFTDADDPGAWPLRPDSPAILPARAVIRLRTGDTDILGLQIAAEKSGRAWHAITGEGWLSCALSSRSAACAVALRVTVDARGLAPGTHRTFVGVAFDDGGRRCVPLDVEVEPASTVTRCIEAESLPAAPGFRPVADPTVGSGRVLRVVSTGAGVGLTFDFDLPSADQYYLMARVRASGAPAEIAGEDSLGLRIDGGAPIVWDLFNLSDGAWTWIRATPMERVSGNFPLAAGHHRIEIDAREPGLLIDRIAVSNNPFQLVAR